jgi:tetratricopeptide (TPR) repeat protein
MEAIPWHDRPAQKRWKVQLVHAETSLKVDKNTEELYQDALHQAVQQVGHDHPDVAEAATYLADLYMYLERFTEAESLYRRAIKIYALTLGDDHMVYSMSLRNLADCLEARGKRTDAENMRSQARGIFG